MTLEQGRNDTAERTAVVTGASSGVGFEAAAQLARAGYGRVIVTARSDAKAERTQKDLRTQEQSDVFEALTLDLDDLGSTSAAAATLAGGPGKIDVLILNAGLTPTSELRRTSDGFEAIAAATLTGHHLLTRKLLDADALSSDARIVIAGSEAAIGDVPIFTPTDIDRLASREFDGDLERAIDAVIRMEPPLTYKPNNQYATVKALAALWAAELATRLPAGTTVNAVSPGNTPDTNAAEKMPAFMRRVMLPIMKLVPGMSHSTSDAAGRYLEAIRFGPETNGKFFASKPKRMTGPLQQVRSTSFDNVAVQRALWDELERLTIGASTEPR